MTLLIDAAPLVALADPGEPCRDEILMAERGALVIPAPTTAEIDYLPFNGADFGEAEVYNGRYTGHYGWVHGYYIP